MTAVKLELLKREDEEQFIKDNQDAFNYGAKQYFSEEEMKEQNEEDGQIIARETILQSIHHEGAITYRILCRGEKVGGLILDINGNQGDLEILFVTPSCHSKGIGQAAWKEVEKLYPNVKVWKTFTPTFEKRNIHFYVNKLGFHIVAYYNEHFQEPEMPEDMWEMYKFQKVLK